MTVGQRKYFVYRYQGKINDCDEAVVVLCYPQQAFDDPNALRVFVSTKTDLTTEAILNLYLLRWKNEVFFRDCKQKLAFDKCQLRSQRGIERFWLILSLVYFLCCTVEESEGSFSRGYRFLSETLVRTVTIPDEVLVCKETFVQFSGFAHS